MKEYYRLLLWKLRILMKHRGKTYRDMAREGINLALVFRKPEARTLATWEKLARILGVDMADLMNVKDLQRIYAVKKQREVEK